jgi:hypothetical protein
MRLKARVELKYANRVWQPGMLFDAPDSIARGMIGRDEAEPFNLEDPSTRTLSDAIENLLPPEPPVPDEAPVSLSPTGAIPPAAGGADLFRVTMTGTGTWTATSDSAWLTLDSPSGPQTQSGDVHYTVAPNLGPGTRAGDINVNSETFTVTQAAPVLP